MKTPVNIEKTFKLMFERIVDINTRKRRAGIYDRETQKLIERAIKDFGKAGEKNYSEKRLRVLEEMDTYLEKEEELVHG